MRQTLQQERAAFALAEVEQAQRDLPPKRLGEYRAYAKHFPTMVHMNGLGPAAAFFRSKRGTHERLYRSLERWLCAEGRPYAGVPDLLEAVTGRSAGLYRAAQAEALAVLEWFKTLATALIEPRQDAVK